MKIKMGIVILAFSLLAGKAFALNGEIAVLNYHNIISNTSPPNQYAIPISEFNSQLAWLKANGYNTITQNQLVGYMNNKTLIPGNAVVIVFDDGWINQSTIAAPLLKADNFTATFCVIEQGMFNTSWLGPGEGGGNNNIRFNLSSALYMQNIDHDEMCGHTYSHWYLVTPSGNPGGKKANWTLQLNVSTQVFRSNGLIISTFTPPYCDYNASLITWIQKLGYIGMKTCMNNFGTFQKPKHDPRFNYLTGSPYGITTIEPNITLANITLFGRVITTGNLPGTTTTTTTTSTTSTTTSSSTSGATTTILSGCIVLGKENGAAVQLCNINGTDWVSVVQLTGLGQIKNYIAGITNASTTSTTVSTTTTISGCSATPSLVLSPNPSGQAAKITANVSVTGCGGTIVNIDTYEGCTSGVVIATCISGTLGCSTSFTSPSAAGGFGYWSCIGTRGTKAHLVVN